MEIRKLSGVGDAALSSDVIKASPRKEEER